MMITRICLLFAALFFSQLSWGQISLNSWLKDRPVSEKAEHLFYASTGGGADTGGGGTGVLENGKLRLRDFVGCRGLKNIELGREPFGIEISDGILRLDSQSIKSILEKSSPVSNVLLQKIILAGASLANWYVVDADLYLDNKDERKMAVFKRSIGIVMDRRKLAQLSDVDTLGLLFHESLRMVSLGFGIDLATEDIEDITCKVYSGQKLNLDRYPKFEKYLQYLLSDTTLNFKSREQGIRFWENEFSAMTGKDGKEPSRIWVRRYYFQRDQSKFEILRKISQRPEHLQNAFFGWAAQQAPQECSSVQECAYSEEWQPSRIWDLSVNTVDKIGWKNRATNQEWVASKKAYPQNFADLFCRNLGEHFKSLTRSETESLRSIQEIGLLINRKDLNEIEHLGFPFFLDLKNVQLMIWYQQMNSSMDARFSFALPLGDGKARALCFTSNSAQ